MMRLVFILLLLFPLCLSAAEPEGVTAPSYLLVEMGTFQIIAGKDYHKRLPPASTTKVMTTLLAIEKLEGNETIMPGKEVRAISASKMNLIPGKGYKSNDLMKGAMVESANDAAYALAVYIGGTESGFATMMNEKARALGAVNTNFVNASGLPVDDQYTTCYDLAIIFKQALLSPRFREIVSTEYFLFQDAYKRVQYKNHNRLLFCFEPSIGGKTGYTRKAKHCYVGAFEKDGKVYILTLLGSRNLWGDSIQILKTLYDRVPTDEELRLAKYCSTSLTSHRVKKPVKPTAKKKVSRTKKKVTTVN
jgi:serine-type D-Ala-D-Ala carboxypeptidase (penicillin-binding protein 5/6)